MDVRDAIDAVKEHNPEAFGAMVEYVQDSSMLAELLLELDSQKRYDSVSFEAILTAGNVDPVMQSVREQAAKNANPRFTIPEGEGIHRIKVWAPPLTWLSPRVLVASNETRIVAKLPEEMLDAQRAMEAGFAQAHARAFALLLPWLAPGSAFYFEFYGQAQNRYVKTSEGWLRQFGAMRWENC